MSKIADIDIDVADREKLLSQINHVKALSADNKTPHVCGIYIQEIPLNPKTGTASMNFETANDFGYFKIDILNNSIYEKVVNEHHLEKLMAEPDWGRLLKKKGRGHLPHIHNHYDIVERMKPSSVQELAMVIAMIRPAKRHLVGKNWNIIKKHIWTKPANGDYYFKKSHSTAYAVSIVVQMNLNAEK